MSHPEISCRCLRISNEVDHSILSSQPKKFLISTEELALVASICY